MASAAVAVADPHGVGVSENSDVGVIQLEPRGRERRAARLYQGISTANGHAGWRTRRRMKVFPSSLLSLRNLLHDSS